MSSSPTDRSIPHARCTALTLLVAAACLLTPATASAQIPATERAALDALYQATDGPRWTDHRFWGGLGGVECSWTGVTCDEAGEHVVELRLPENNLHGRLPDQLRDLTRLRVLDLSGNQRLSSGIPAALGDLGELEILDLHGTSLRGEIPPRLALLPWLRRLDLSQCFLTGTIPPDLGYLPSLQILSLADNELAGRIPFELGRLSNLLELHLEQNRLTGPIPASVARIARLEAMVLARNHLDGPLPSWLGGLASLRVLDLSDNAFTGPIPEELGELRELVSLDLSANPLGGMLPTSLGGLGQLQILRLADVMATGSIPATLGNLDRLEILDLSSNRFEGPIPDELSGLTGLRSLLVDQNRLSGEVPAWIGGLSQLTELGLESNRLEGPLPEKLADLTRLRVLRVAANRLVGEIPSGLGPLPNLTEVTLSWNGLWTHDSTFDEWLEERNRRPEGVASPWSATQAVPPATIQVRSLLPTSCKLQWPKRPAITSATSGLPLDLPIRFRVEVATSPDGPFEPVVTLADADPGATNGSRVVMLEPDTTYFVRVRGLAWPHRYNPGNVVLGAASDVITVHTPLATTWYVEMDGDDRIKCDSPQRTCASLEGALTFARDGDRVLMGSIPYRRSPWGPLGATTIEKDISLEGLSPAATALSVLKIMPGVVVSVRNATVMHLSASSAEVTLRSVKLEVNDFSASAVLIDRSLLSQPLTLREQSHAMLSNSTISYFSASQVNRVSGSLTLLSSTLSAEPPSAAAAAFELDNGRVQYAGSILAGGSRTCGPEAWYTAPWAAGFTSLGGNVVEGDTCKRIDEAGDLLVDDALLGPLQDNGGEVMTLMPRADSEAVDRVDPAAAPATDARGVTRPQGKAADAGACERVPADGEGPQPRYPAPRRL